MSQIPKYRPVLSASHITHILMLAKRDMSRESVSVISILAPFEWKIENGSVRPAHVTAPESDIFNSLGLTETPELSTEVNKVKMEVLWYRYKENPTSLSLTEINQALEYGYTNDLMTTAEEIAYQNSIITSGA